MKEKGHHHEKGGHEAHGEHAGHVRSHAGGSHAGHSHSAHSHAGHSHAPEMSHLNRAFILGITLNLLYVGVEFGMGLYLDSMALISDAGHNLSDVVSLVLALLAFKLAQARPNGKFTYGYKKSTVLVSLANAVLLIAVVGVIIWESVGKLGHLQPVEGGAIAWVAGIGIAVNAFTAWLFMKDRKRDLNVQGAYLHMVADALVSVGVVVSGIAIGFTGWYVIDPLMGIAIAGVILFSTMKLLMQSLRLSLDGVPEGFSPESVRRGLMESEPDIEDVHHIHIWAISTTENAFTGHVVVREGADAAQVKMRVKHELELMGIRHATIETEYPGEHCHPCDCGGADYEE